LAIEEVHQQLVAIFPGMDFHNSIGLVNL
jgi:hypothetical protein